METQKCKSCKSDIAKGAKKCPHCKTDLRNWFVRHWIITGFIIVVIIWNIAPPPEWSTQVDSSIKQIPKSPEQIRIEKIDSQFSLWDWSHKPSKDIILSWLKDPDSYEIIKTWYVDKWDYIIVQTKYRAKNSFGGYIVEYMKAKFSLDWDFIEIHTSIWDKE